MPSKNNIAGLIRPKSTLTQSPPVPLEVAPVQKNKKARPGRKPKPIAEKEQHPVPIRFTDAEFEQLQKKAGDVPLATFIKKLLREETNLFGK